MHKYTAKLSLLLLIILEASIYDEGVLSEGVLSGRSLCLDGVMYGGGFVLGGFVLPSWQVDKEALWLIESPTYLSKYTPPILGICRFYFKIY